MAEEGATGRPNKARSLCLALVTSADVAYPPHGLWKLQYPGTCQRAVFVI